MHFADLTDTNFVFLCEATADGCELWEYDFSIIRWNDKVSRNLSQWEINQLRENCVRILEATNSFQGGN